MALALLHQAELVFLGEITTGLEPSARRVTRRLREQVRELGATIVLVTHFMADAGGWDFLAPVALGGIGILGWVIAAWRLRRD
ncbi:MAG: hypothetical protein V9G19_02965 [Tetrasphaera sp.]